MNIPGIQRRVLATLLLLAIFIIDLFAVNHIFQSTLQVTIFGIVLGIQTILILTYHLRCLECEGCMKQAGQGIWLFYKVFAAISFLSIAIIFMGKSVPTTAPELIIGLSLIYAVLLIMGISTAFKAIIGVKNVAIIEQLNTSQEKPQDTDKEEAHAHRPSPEKLDILLQQQETIDKWEKEKAARREDAIKCMQAEKEKRHEALQRLQERNTTYNW